MMKYITCCRRDEGARTPRGARCLSGLQMKRHKESVKQEARGMRSSAYNVRGRQLPNKERLRPVSDGCKASAGMRARPDDQCGWVACLEATAMA